MIEEQLRDGLRAAVTQEPPLGFDPDELADTARRAAHRRRTAWATAAAATIVAVGAIGAVATFGRTAGPGVEPGHRGGGMTEVASPETAAFELGESLARALPFVEPKAKNFDVRADPYSSRGVVLYKVSGQPAALAFRVEYCPPPTAHRESCSGRLTTDYLNARDGGEVWGVSKERDGVVLNLMTGEHVETIDSEFGPMFSKTPCMCPPTTLRPLSTQQLATLVKHPELKLFFPDRVVTEEELRQQKELQLKQAELEAEVDRLKREAEESAQESAENSSGGK